MENKVYCVVYDRFPGGQTQVIGVGTREWAEGFQSSNEGCWVEEVSKYQASMIISNEVAGIVMKGGIEALAKVMFRTKDRVFFAWGSSE